MVGLGLAHGSRPSPISRRWTPPLGRAVGNALEVSESVDVLRGEGPSDVRELTLALAALMLELVGLDVDPAPKLDDGSAYALYERMIRAQGGDPEAPLPVAPLRRVVEAPRAGFVRGVNAMSVGVAAWRLGAGRARKEDRVSASAGVLCWCTRTSSVEAGQPLFELHAEDEPHLERGLEAIADAVTIGDAPSSDGAPRTLDVIRD
jgi:thymidine phosphorylase